MEKTYENYLVLPLLLLLRLPLLLLLPICERAGTRWMGVYIDANSQLLQPRPNLLPSYLLYPTVTAALPECDGGGPNKKEIAARRRLLQCTHWFQPLPSLKGEARSPFVGISCIMRALTQLKPDGHTRCKASAAIPDVTAALPECDAGGPNENGIAARPWRCCLRLHIMPCQFGLSLLRGILGHPRERDLVQPYGKYALRLRPTPAPCELRGS